MKKNEDNKNKYIGTIAAGVAGIAAGAAAATIISRNSDTIKEMYHRVKSEGDTLGKAVDKKISQATARVAAKK